MNEIDLELYLSRIERRYRQVAALLTPMDLQRQDVELPRSADDLLGYAGSRTRTDLFVGYYSLAGLEDALSRYGLLGRVAQVMGCRQADLVLSIDTADPFRHVLRIHARPFTAPLVELRLHLQDHPCEARVSGGDYAGYVSCEWLTLQHPGASFSAQRPRLPGQLHPGLGIGAEVQTLLVLLTERLRRHGLLAYPAWYHTAAMYALRFRFLDPRAEGVFRALRRDGMSLPLDVLSWAVELGCVRWADGSLYEWQAREEVLPLSPAMLSYLESPDYAAACAAAEAGARFSIDLGLLQKRRPVAEREAEELSRRAYRAAQAAHGSSPG